MATTTPNYGWTVPTSSDLVKDGATAIETLGDAIDASMNTALGTKKAGMVLLNTTSFSGVASHSLAAGTFNATYTNYRILITSLFGSAGGINVNLRLRKSGVDNSDSNSYRRTGFTSVAGALTNSTSTDNVFYMTSLNGSSSAPAMIDTILYSPFVNNQTQINRVTYRSDDEAMNLGVGRHTTADTFDSASFITNSGTMTGTISVYGFNV
jgi:hypothetical protein